MFYNTNVIIIQLYEQFVLQEDHQFKLLVCDFEEGYWLNIFI